MNGFTLYWGIAVAGLSLVAGCSSSESCEQPSESYCDGNVMHMCYPEDSTSGTQYFWRVQTCSTAERCQTSQSGTFCSLEAEKNPQCEPRGYFCKDGVREYCKDGYVVSRTFCKSCDEVGYTCPGQRDYDCEETSDCSPMLTCEANQYAQKKCVAHCDCPSGERCAACEVFQGVDNQALYCVQGRCQKNGS